MMRKTRLPLELLLIIFLGLAPLLWFKEGYIIARGDYFPFWMTSKRTLKNDLNLWSSHNLGNSNAWAASLPYELAWLFSETIGIDAGIIQILFETFLFLGAGISMYFLVGAIYPKLRLAAIVSSIFYMFNFFVVQNVLNIGMGWTYTFLPIVMLLLIKTLEAASNNDSSAVNRNACYFALASIVALSFASVNPTNIVLTFAVLSILLVYYFLRRERIASLFKASIKLGAISGLANLWWLIPILNHYSLSSSGLNPDVNVAAWSWTHVRASFLNISLLNGFWGWRPEYYPYYESYSNPILIILVAVPILLSASALLFKTKKSFFNAYIMICCLVMIFLAKGLHEPLGQLNLLLYSIIPSMAMFREPTTKFTMALIPFLSILIGYSVHHIAGIKIGNKIPSRLTKILVVAFFSGIFVMSAYPLITNPIETKTALIPFSSYVKIPSYWYEATRWLDNQPGNDKILVTPGDDHYQMPYTWGYFGTDEFLERLIQKPILSNYYAYYYKTDPDVTLAFQQLYSTIKYNKTEEFKAFLDLLNVKYVLQRNDVQYDLTGRNIMSPNEMQAFLIHQPYIHLAQRFGQLDIYEYLEPKPYVYVVSPTTLEQTKVTIENVTLLERSWYFTSPSDVLEWQNATKPSQWQINYTMTQENTTLRAELWNSTWGWKTISSPLLPVEYGAAYQIQADIKGQNAHQVHVKIAEYDTAKKILTINYLTHVNDGTFNWTHTFFKFEPTDQTTKYLQVQIWHGHETDKPYPNIIWVDNIIVYGHTMRLNTAGLDLIFHKSIENQPAIILDYSKVNPTKIVATINATRPFTLAVSEALDQSWKAYINGKQVKNSPLYLGLRGFYVNQTGLLKVTIEYPPQQWFLWSSIISALTSLVCTAYLIYNYLNGRDLWKRLKLLHSKRACVAAMLPERVITTGKTS